MYYDFVAVGEIWEAYFAGSISMRKRDALLAGYRAALEGYAASRRS